MPVSVIGKVARVRIPVASALIDLPERGYVEVVRVAFVESVLHAADQWSTASEPDIGEGGSALDVGSKSQELFDSCAAIEGRLRVGWE